MPSYSLSLEGPEEKYVPSYDFSDFMRPGSTFSHGGTTWRVVEVAVKQFDAEGEPGATLRCVPA